MVFKNLTLQNFRNFQYENFEFDKGMNVIYGQNAQGKTNILEALWLFTGAKSFRSSKDSELIKFQETSAKIDLKFFAENREQECTININKSRSAILNGVEHNSTLGIVGKINAIVFSPNDLNIIKDGPVFRRKFMDTCLCQLYPAYLGVSKRYVKALDQRNSILKNLKFNPNMEEFIEDFEKELAVCGASIIKYRKRFVEELNKYLPKIFSGISEGKEKIFIFYDTSAGENEEEFLDSLKKSRFVDMQQQSTTIGPHRDDLNIEINNISARVFGSQGQKRSAALALKLSESAVISEITGNTPIALLDDVMSELDISRQNYILNHIDGWQVFLTCCDIANTKNLTNGKIFEIENGKIKL
ncbi:MAG: DNA replication/repair protein RecF [Clostridia bacterium]|nr:DNA replication/repair protein RecF [Clostridia bacterium]